MKWQSHYPDPGIQCGHFRVLPYTAGGYVVIDDRRPIARQRVGRMGQLEDAANYAAILDAEDGEVRR